MELISQGAEGKVYTTLYLGKEVVCKERVSKGYRIKFLDEKINKQRLLHEARCIAKCQKQGIPTPCLYFVDTLNHRLYMEKIEGETMKSFLWRKRETLKESAANVSNSYDGECSALVKQMGIIIGLMHESDIVHGDLTTSNIMIRTTSPTIPNTELVLIDFGLGMMKPTIEDKAVDLYVLERAFLSTHPESETLIEEMIQGYRSTPGHKLATQILSKLESVM